MPGAIENEHEGGGGGGPATPSWLIVNDWPATDIEVERAGPVFARTANDTDPVPLPELPATMVTHGALLVAVQAHPADVVTVTVPAPPAVVND